VEIDVDNRGSLEISLIENLQRKDLTPFEEATALQRLCDQFGYTHDQLARKLGKSRPSITETLSLNRMPEPVQDICRQADITSRFVSNRRAVTSRSSLSSRSRRWSAAS